jgi:hypothetical protein
MSIDMGYRSGYRYDYAVWGRGTGMTMWVWVRSIDRAIGMGMSMNVGYWVWISIWALDRGIDINMWSGVEIGMWYEIWSISLRYGIELHETKTKTNVFTRSLGLTGKTKTPFKYIARRE